MRLLALALALVPLATAATTGDESDIYRRGFADGFADVASAVPQRLAARHSTGGPTSGNYGLCVKSCQREGYSSSDGKGHVGHRAARTGKRGFSLAKHDDMNSCIDRCLKGHS